MCVCLIISCGLDETSLCYCSVLQLTLSLQFACWFDYKSTSVWSVWCYIIKANMHCVHPASCMVTPASYFSSYTPQCHLKFCQHNFLTAKMPKQNHKTPRPTHKNPLRGYWCEYFSDPTNEMPLHKSSRPITVQPWHVDSYKKWWITDATQLHSWWIHEGHTWVFVR